MNKKEVNSQTEYQARYAQSMDSYFAVGAQQVRYKTERFSDGSLKSRQPIISACEFPTFEGFAVKIGADAQRLAEWERERPDFAAACGRARLQQKKILITNALAGLYNSSFTQFMLINRFGGEYSAKPEGEQESGLDINVVYGREGDASQRSDGEV